METTTPSHSADPFTQFKAQQREGWASFAPLEAVTTPTAAKLVNFAEVRSGQKVLDIGCGTGVVAVTAACRGAHATGLDLTPILLERARVNAKNAGVSIEFIEGDAEQLPFADETFDVVLSQFGHMFAPRPAIALAEMLRVLKKGGRLAFSTWPPQFYTGKMFSLVGQYLTPPAGAASPVLWGDTKIIQERLGDAVRDLAFDGDRMLTPGLSPRQCVARFEESAAPVMKVVQLLKENPSKLEEFRAALIALVATYWRDNQLHQDFLMTRAVKK